MTTRKLPELLGFTVLGMDSGVYKLTGGRFPLQAGVLHLDPESNTLYLYLEETRSEAVFEAVKKDLLCLDTRRLKQAGWRNVELDLDPAWLPTDWRTQLQELRRPDSGNCVVLGLTTGDVARLT